MKLIFLALQTGAGAMSARATAPPVALSGPEDDILSTAAQPLNLGNMGWHGLS